MIALKIKYQHENIDVYYEPEKKLVCIPYFKYCDVVNEEGDIALTLFQWMDEDESEAIDSEIMRHIEREVHDNS